MEIDEPQTMDRREFVKKMVKNKGRMTKHQSKKINYTPQSIIMQLYLPMIFVFEIN